jgi:cytochrome oxidase Cu insertion factor (SCO1/SenC/PrrC family)
MSWHQHFAGSLLLFGALGVMLLLPFLPARSAATLGLDALDQFEEDIVVAFAGYPGCSTVCPTTLATMARARDQLQQPDIGLAFINIDRYARPAQSVAYAQAFHADFRAITVADTSAQSLMSELGLTTFDDTSSQPAHPGYLFVLTRTASDWRIAELYRRLPNDQTLTRDLARHAQQRSLPGQAP